jgi:hypothetical protein
MALWQWSTTAANNATADPSINWQEGQPPSSVNDSARAMMAAIATWFAAPEWINYGLTPTYVSATQFTVPGNQTSTYTVGRKVRAFVTAGTIYGTITASAFSSLTTVTVAWGGGGALDNGVSEVDVGLLNQSFGGALLNVQVITASGTYTPTPGAQSAIVIGGGAGAQGGGTGSTSSGNVSAASGGGSGTIGAIYIPRGSLTSQTVTVGVGGNSAAAGAVGNNGGQSSFGALLVLPGGIGGNIGNVSGGTSGNGDVGAASPALPAAPSGTGQIIFSSRGQPGTPGFNLLNPLGGSGGNSPFGSGGVGGASSGNSQAAKAGFNGTNGFFLVLEFA